MSAGHQAALAEIRASARRVERSVVVLQRSFSAPESPTVEVLFVQVDGAGPDLPAPALTDATFVGLGGPSRFAVVFGPEDSRKVLAAALTSFAAKTLAAAAIKSTDAPTADLLLKAALEVDGSNPSTRSAAGAHFLARARSRTLSSEGVSERATEAAAHFREALRSGGPASLQGPARIEAQVGLAEALLLQSGFEEEVKTLLVEAGSETASPRARISARFLLARASARLRDANGAFGLLESSLVEAARTGQSALVAEWVTTTDFDEIRADARWAGLTGTYLTGPAAFPARRRVQVARDSKEVGQREKARAWLGSNGCSTLPAVDAAVLSSLRWLKAHQRDDGGWSCAQFGNWCNGKASERVGEGGGLAEFDVGVSALAALAFLGAGYPAPSPDPEGFGAATEAAVAYLEAQQDKEGCFGIRLTNRYGYGHAAATLALVEAYAAAPSPRRRRAGQRGLDFVAVMRNPYFAWRYGVKPGDNDSSVTAWMTMALRGAALVNAAEVREGRAAPFAINGGMAFESNPNAVDDVWEGVKTWFEKVTDTDGVVGYQVRGAGLGRAHDREREFPAMYTWSCTAQGLCCRLAMGQKAADPQVSQAVALLRREPPTDRKEGTDYCYWYFGSMALREIGGPVWKGWQDVLTKLLPAAQRKDGTPCEYQGSWDPKDVWSQEGGRVYATAMITMILEAPYRCHQVPTKSK